VSTSKAVVDIANREVNGVIRLLTRRDGDGCLVAAEYNRYKHASVCRRVLGNDVLS
jgi:hypothetical protein